jgi:hypothetical protein
VKEGKEVKEGSAKRTEVVEGRKEEGMKRSEGRNGKKERKGGRTLTGEEKGGRDCIKRGGTACKKMVEPNEGGEKRCTERWRERTQVSRMSEREEVGAQTERKREGVQSQGLYRMGGERGDFAEGTDLDSSPAEDPPSLMMRFPPRLPWGSLSLIGWSTMVGQ